MKMKDQKHLLLIFQLLVMLILCYTVHCKGKYSKGERKFQIKPRKGKDELLLFFNLVSMKVFVIEPLPRGRVL